MARWVSQLALPIAYIFSHDLLQFAEWRGLYLFELGLTLFALGCVLMLKLPPGAERSHECDEDCAAGRIAQAERAIAAADAGLAAARDRPLPSIRLSASGGVQAYSVSQLLRSPILLWSIGGSVLAPLFDGGRLRAQADIAASVRDRAVFTYETVVRNAFADTDNALCPRSRYLAHN